MVCSGQAKTEGDGDEARRVNGTGSGTNFRGLIEERTAVHRTATGFQNANGRRIGFSILGNRGVAIGNVVTPFRDIAEHIDQGVFQVPLGEITGASKRTTLPV